MLYQGYKLKIGDEEYLVPALSLGQLRNGMIDKLKKHDEMLNSGQTYEAAVARGEIILEALKRNYPNFDEAKLFDHLDIANTHPIWMSVLGASGFPLEATAAEPKVVTEAGTSDPSIAA